MAEHAHERRPGPARVPGLLWATFATTAVLTALVVPAHILVQGVLGPLGLVPSFDGRHSTFAAAMANPLVKIYFLVFFAIVFFTFGHRTLYTLIDLGAPVGKRVLAPIMYGLALVLIVIAGYVLFTVP